MAGTYDLTSRVLYAAAGTNLDSDRRGTIMITAGSAGAYTVQIIETSGTSVRRQSGVAIKAGTQVTFTPSCPAPTADGGNNGGGTAGFDATATTFVLYDQNGNGQQRVNTYTMR